MSGWFVARPVREDIQALFRRVLKAFRGRIGGKIHGFAVYLGSPPRQARLSSSMASLSATRAASTFTIASVCVRPISATRS